MTLFPIFVRSVFFCLSLRMPFFVRGVCCSRAILKISRSLFARLLCAQRHSIRVPFRCAQCFLFASHSGKFAISIRAPFFVRSIILFESHSEQLAISICMPVFVCRDLLFWVCQMEHIDCSGINATNSLVKVHHLSKATNCHKLLKFTS